MTYVQYINCDKWKKVIGISLWVGASIGLGFSEYICYEYYQNGYDPGYCTIAFSTTSEQNTCIKDHAGNPTGLILVSIVNVVNYIGIWYVMNNHYRWMEIRCGKKPSPNEVKHE